jgi:hypothetical protein
MLLQQLRAFSALVATFAFACSSPTDLVRTDATVVNAGCWFLVTNGDKYYQPVDLASTFQVDGLAVRVLLRDAPEWGSVCMRGPMVHVVEIQLR